MQLFSLMLGHTVSRYNTPLRHTLCQNKICCYSRLLIKYNEKLKKSHNQAPDDPGIELEKSCLRREFPRASKKILKAQIKNVSMRGTPDTLNEIVLNMKHESGHINPPPPLFRKIPLGKIFQLKIFPTPLEMLPENTPCGK